MNIKNGGKLNGKGHLNLWKVLLLFLIKRLHYMILAKAD